MKNRKKGFTLVELIVVLVILVILAAILVPALIGWIQKSKEKSVIMECRQCVVASQALASEQYAHGGTLSLETDREGIIRLAEVSGTITELNAENAIVSKLVYKSTNDVEVTYENGEYTVGASSGDISTQLGQLGAATEKSQTLFNDLQSNLPKNSFSSIDTESENTKKIIEAFKTAGVDLENANSWTYTNRNDTGNTNYSKIYWSTQDTPSTDNTKYMMAYTLYTGNYKVCKVRTDSSGKVTGEISQLVPQEDQKDFEKVKQIYLDAIK